MTLQDTFYVLGIIFMSLMLLITIGLLVAVLVIRAKVVALHNAIDAKIAMVTDIPKKGAAIVNSVKDAVTSRR